MEKLREPVRDVSPNCIWKAKVESKQCIDVPGKPLSFKESFKLISFFFVLGAKPQNMVFGFVVFTPMAAFSSFRHVSSVQAVVQVVCPAS